MSQRFNHERRNQRLNVTVTRDSEKTCWNTNPTTHVRLTSAGSPFREIYNGFKRFSGKLHINNKLKGQWVDQEVRSRIQYCSQM